MSQSIARGLARKGITPNSISVAGMICGILAGAALAATNLISSDTPLAVRALWVVAALLMQCRLLANLFDGMVAVEQGLASPVGELYNEVPDRVSDVCIMVGAGYAFTGHVTLGFIAAVAAMFTAYVRAMGKAAIGRYDFSGPMAKQQRMAILTAFCLFAVVTPARWWTASAANFFTPLRIVLLVVIVGSAFTALRRLRHIATALKQPQP